MAVTALIGGETAHEHSEGLAVLAGAAPTYPASPRQVSGKGGAACIRFAAAADFKQARIAGTLPDPVGGVRFSIKVFARPSASTQIWVLRNSAGGYFAYFMLRADGLIEVYNQADALIGTTTVALTAGNWFNVWLAWDRTNSNLKVYVRADDGTAPGAAQVSGSVSFAAMGWLEFGSSPWGSSGNVDYDDLLVFDTATLPHQDAVVVLHKPVSDNANVGWRGGAGGSTNLYDAVDNTPPAGVHNDNSTNGTQLVDGNNNTTDTYDANVESYTAKGVAALDVVLAVQAIIEHGFNEATVRSNAVRVVSNPAVAEVTGNTTGAAPGVFPTNWARLATSVANSPSVTPSAQPVVRLRRNSLTAQNAQCCLVGMLSAVQVTRVTPVAASTREPLDVLNAVSTTPRELYDMAGQAAATTREAYDTAGSVASAPREPFDVLNVVAALTREPIVVLRTTAPYRNLIMGTPGLLAYWRLGDDGSNNVVADELGANPGTRGANISAKRPPLVTGDSDPAYDFPGGIAADTGAVAIPAAAALQPTQWTLEAIVSLDSTSVVGGSAIITSDNVNARVGFQLALEPASSPTMTTRRLQVGYYDGAWRFVREPVDLPAGVHHVVGSYDGTTLRLYRNGVQVATSSPATVPLYDPASRTLIGRRHDVDNRYANGVFPGVIDEVAIYNRALSAAEVKEHYDSGVNNLSAASASTREPYDGLATVGVTVRELYDKAGLISASTREPYDVRTAVARLIREPYDVRTAVARSIAEPFDLRQLAARLVRERFNVIGFVPRRFVAPVWRFIACSAPGGSELGELFAVRSSRTSLPLVGLPTCDVTIDLDNPMADQLLGSGANDRINRLLKGYRNGRLMFVMPLVAAEESADADSAIVSASAVGPAWRLARRLLGPSVAGYNLGSPLDLHYHAYMIGVALDLANARGDTGIRKGVVDNTGSPQGYIATVYFKKASELMAELGPGTLGGPEMEYVPTEPTADASGVQIATLNIVPSVGGDHTEDAVFEHGTGRRNISGYRKPTTLETALNRAFGLPPGFPDAIAAGDAVVQSDDTPSRNARGLLEDVVPNDLSIRDMRQQLVDEHIRVRQEPREQILFTPVPNLLDDYGPGGKIKNGDIVTARAVHNGRVRFNANVRLYGVSFATDEQALESAELTLVNEGS